MRTRNEEKIHKTKMILPPGLTAFLTLGLLTRHVVAAPSSTARDNSPVSIVLTLSLHEPVSLNVYMPSRFLGEIARHSAVIPRTQTSSAGILGFQWTITTVLLVLHVLR